MKKYIIILSLFILFMLGVAIAGKSIDKYLNPQLDSSENTTQAQLVNGGTSNAENISNNPHSSNGTSSTLEPNNVTVYEVEEERQEETVYQEPQVQTQDVVLQMDSKLTENDWNKRKETGLEAAHIDEIMKQSTGLYAYDMMDDLDHQLYAEMYLILSQCADGVALCTLDENKIDFVYNCVMTDHPEIFYADGYVYTKHTENGVLKKITFAGKYTMSSASISSMQQEIDKYAAAALSGISIDADAYDKVKYVYEYLINHTEYNLNSIENQNICSVFVYGQSVCQGYAKSMQYLLTKLNVPCTLVVGHVSSGEGHAWNLVQIHDSYYYVDATWGDASYIADTENGQCLVGISYDYLNITTDELCKTHIIENVVPVPRCISNSDNYFVKENLYITSVDDNAFTPVFQNAYAQQKEFISIKCQDASVYSQVQTTLLEEQKIFDYLRDGTQSLTYVSNPDQLTYTFLL